MKHFLFVLSFVLLGTMYSLAQTTVSGGVKNNEGETLPGVNVFISGTTTGTVTDIDGNFRLNVPDVQNGELFFSYIGYESQTIKLNGKTTVNVILKQEFIDLDEVVVVGYGEVRKSDLTGSTVSVVEEAEVARQYVSVDRLLQGRASGVQIIGNGDPGSAISVRIRGANSLRGSNEPLYVVDGVIINSAAEDVDENTGGDSNELQAPQNGLTGLNPSDIENIEVLKDASATAIYGSRGANGVVIITTKSGTSGADKHPKVNFYATTDISKITNKIDVLDGIGYANYQNEYSELQGNSLKYHVEGDMVYPFDADGAVVYDSPYTQVDWQDEMYTTGISYNSGLSIGGNNGKTRYYFSSAYSDQSGVVEITNIKRGDLRLNLNTPLSDKITLDTRISLMYQDGSFANGGSKSGGTRSFVVQTLSYRPLIGSYDPDEDIDNDLEQSNPYSWLTDYKDVSEELRSNLSASLTYEIVKGLKYKISLGADFRNKERSKWYGTELFKGGQSNGVANYSFLKRYSYSIDNLLIYNRKFNKKHNLNATLGMTYDSWNSRAQLYEVTDFKIKTLEEKVPQNGSTVTVPFAFSYLDASIQSFLGRAVYSFKDKYIATATFRSDAASKFAPGKRTGYFPSGSVAWRAMEEGLIKDLNIFDNLKFRAGWGITGNQAVDPYQTLSTYNNVYYVNNDNTVPAYAPARIPNTDLTWETTEQFNIGVDMAFVDNRIRTTLDVYQKNTKDLLNEVPIGPSNGFKNMWVNLGGMQNKGIEFAIDATVLDKNGLTLDIGGHISRNKSMIKDLGLDPANIYIDGEAIEKVFYLGEAVSSGNYFKTPANIFMEGEEVGLFWGHETRGIYEPTIDYAAMYGQETADAYAEMFDPGDILYVDHNGDGQITDADKTFIGNPNPDFIFGFNVKLAYKNLSVSALFDGSYGNDIINAYNLQIGYASGLPTNILTDTYENSWRASDPDEIRRAATYPRMGTNFVSSSKIPDTLVEDGSFLRLNNLTVSYDFKVKGFAGIEGVNLYATGRNLWTLTNYSGFNPQINSFLFNGLINGVDWTGSPNIRTYLLGFNVSF